MEIGHKRQREEVRRKDRINRLYLKIKSLRSIEKQKAIDYCGIEWGLSRRKALEYISILITNGLIKHIKVDGSEYLEVGDVEWKSDDTKSQREQEVDRILG